LPGRAGGCPIFVPLEDGRGYSECIACQEALAAKPDEVLFGIHLKGNGDITFSIGSVKWFHKNRGQSQDT
jgi:hypothetical protein